MSDSDFDVDVHSTKLHSIYGHHHHEHALSAVDLTVKLEQLQMDDDNNSHNEEAGQQPDHDNGFLQPESDHEGEHHRHRSHHRRHHSRSRSRHHSRQRSTITVDPELQKWSHETLHEILEHLEQQRRESEFFHQSDDSGFGLAPGLEDNGSGRMRHTQGGLSPEILRDLSSRHRSLKQSHGQANLRHS
ncbi:MAG: hypothetical protein J3R72DRAFT_423265 [Linnemannia gamsii]|nr:MAG: hypothetical protein J3R72DRAFT_423265 [Linnemannia gamsii]